MNHCGAAETEVVALRRCARDIAALSALPAIWITSDFNRGLQNLADVLGAAMRARFVYIRIERPNQAPAEVVSTDSLRAQPGAVARVSRILARMGDIEKLENGGILPGEDAGDSLRVGATRVSASGGVRGVIVAASQAEDFPRATDKLLLTTGAAQIAILIQRSSFEAEVAERSMQLDKTNKELLETKRRLEATLGAAEIGTWTWDVREDRVIADANLARLFGVSLAEAEGSPLDVFVRRVHVDDQPLLNASIQRALSACGEFSAEYRVYSSGQELRWVIARGRVECDDAGRPIQFPGVVLDITERKTAEAGLRSARDAAQAANRAKDQFLAVLSHELRTPLSPILTTVAALDEDRALPAQFRPAIAMIRRNIELETQLIDDLLDVSRITSGKLRLNLHPTSLHDVLRNALETCRNDFNEKSLTVGVFMNASLDLVMADAARLQQVFWNLLRNAAKFTPTGGRVDVRSYNSGSSRIRVEVQDNGVGIAKDAIARVFLPFEQGETSVTRQFGGLGLGLAICRAVMETHGGTIHAHSDGENRGATFTLELATTCIPVEVPQKEPAAPAAANPGYRVLLVEDHVDTAKSLGLLLSMSGFRVTTAHTAGSAIEAAAEQTFDVMVSDLGLPDMDGYSLMREVARRHGLRGIALSGFGMEEDVARARNAGFSEHFVKPVNIARLRAALHRVAAAASPQVEPVL